jgi:hydrogenase nickel incorporation protein HypB
MADARSAERRVLRENDRLANELRARFRARGLLCLNFVSAPGAGKTTLLERTLGSLPAGWQVAVLTGDVETDNDARRIASTGFPVKQITTGGVCHLDANMVTRALAEWSLEGIDVLCLENVGNLVCPTSFDLGEHAKVVLLSVTEGDDAPEKYPAIYRRAEVMVVTKTDLLPYVEFDVERAEALARHVRPAIRQLRVSCTTGEGLPQWLEWLAVRRRLAARDPAVAYS